MMMTVVEKVFIDTNILVYAHLTLSPFHSAAVTRLQDLHNAGAELWISRQILREYLAAMTKPGVLTGSIPIGTLLADTHKIINQFHIAEDGPTITANLLTLIGTISLAGKQVHGANIVATMQAYGIPKLLTHNTADFARFASLITVVPLVP
jgi:predicted nucleic acid-binding protein